MDQSRSGSGRAYALVAALVVASIFLIGAALFHMAEAEANPSVRSFRDSLWWAVVTATTTGYGDIVPGTTTGRVIAVALMLAGIIALSVVTAVVAAFLIGQNRLERLRARGMQDHVVVCGLGEMGSQLVKAFRRQGYKVAVVEKSSANARLSSSWGQGSVVIIGSARERDVLEQARAHRARHLVAVCGDDGTNAEVVAAARSLMRDHRGNLTCAAHVVDPELWQLLRQWEMTPDESFRLVFFNVFDIGARALLDEFPMFGATSLSARTAQAAGAASDKPPHALVVGDGRLVHRLVVHAARRWREHVGPGSTNARIAITLLGQEAERQAELLRLRYPTLPDACDLRALAIAPDSPDFERADYLFDDDGEALVSSAFVCLPEDGRALSAALTLRHRLRGHYVPVVVRMSQEAGLATLLRGPDAPGLDASGLYGFGFLERVCEPELVTGGVNERLARSIHSRYVQEQAGQTGEPADSRVVAPWDDLSEDIRESNRRQADLISDRLKAVGCGLAPLFEWEPAAFEFEPQQLETISRLEHERWAAERRAQGWTYGPRNEDEMTNPYLVEWADLPPDVRHANQEAARELPSLVASAGLQIVPTGAREHV